MHQYTSINLFKWGFMNSWKYGNYHNVLTFLRYSALRNGMIKVLLYHVPVAISFIVDVITLWVVIKSTHNDEYSFRGNASMINSAALRRTLLKTPLYMDFLRNFKWRKAICKSLKLQKVEILWETWI